MGGGQREGCLEVGLGCTYFEEDIVMCTLTTSKFLKMSSLSESGCLDGHHRHTFTQTTLQRTW